MTTRSGARESSQLRELRASAHTLLAQSEKEEEKGHTAKASELHAQAQKKEQDVMKILAGEKK